MISHHNLLVIVRKEKEELRKVLLTMLALGKTNQYIKCIGIPILILITIKLIMKRNTYGIENHVPFMV